MAPPLIALDATLASGDNTGDTSYWVGLISGLSQVENEFDFLLLSDREPPPEVAVSDRMRWQRLRGRRGRWFSLFSMPLAARKAGARAYHTQYNLSPLVGKKGITTIHDVSFFVGPEWFRPKDRFLLQRAVPTSARRAARVITVSETSKRDVAKHLGIDESKIAVTYNAPAPHFRPVSDGECAPLLSSLGIGRPYLLAVGARWPRKNTRLAVEALNGLPASFPHKLVLVGKQGWEDEAQSNRVVRTGYLASDQLPAIYSAATLFLFPSRYEGFGIPMVEAFACGTPVLASKGGSLPEVSGGAAEIADDFAPETWGRHIAALLGDSSKLDAMRRKGLARAKDFSWTDTAKRTLDVYREVSR